MICPLRHPQALDLIIKEPIYNWQYNYWSCEHCGYKWQALRTQDGKPIVIKQEEPKEVKSPFREIEEAVRVECARYGDVTPAIFKITQMLLVMLESVSRKVEKLEKAAAEPPKVKMMGPLKGLSCTSIHYGVHDWVQQCFTHPRCTPVLGKEQS